MGGREKGLLMAGSLRINVVHVTEDFSMANTGVTTALKELVTRLNGTGLSMEVIAAGKDAVEVPEGIPVRLCPEPVWGKPWRYSPSFAPVIGESMGNGSVFHLHGVWMAPQLLSARRCAAYGKPVVLSPHNMLGAWFWKQGLLRRLKKSVYWGLLSGPAFRRVTAVHALTPSEKKELKDYFPGKRIEVIPNGVDLAGVDRELKSARSTGTAERYILFLGRLHPVKGIELLIDAYASIDAKKRTKLVIAGPPSSEEYFKSLKARAERTECGKEIKFTGEVRGPAKWALIKDAWALVAPSYTEGMSMAALEAMACSCPVVTTHNAGLPDVSEGGGILVNPSAEEVRKALEAVFSWSSSERDSRARSARTLIEKKYSWDVIIPRYADFYRSLIGQSTL